MKKVAKFIKYKITGISRAIMDLFILVKIIVLSILCKNRFFIFQVPIHGNLGDQAIIYAENEFLRNNYPDKKIIEVNTSIINKWTSVFKKIVKNNDTILIHGGGFLGTLWLKEELTFRKILNSFSNNKIVVFPQTVYFNESDATQFKESVETYRNHRNLHICCREEYSYNFVKNKMNIENVYLVPDMVLYLKQSADNNERHNVLFCLRNDKEKIDNNYDEIIKFLENKDIKFDYTDTVVEKDIYRFRRKKELGKKIKQFAKYEIVVTDRLHGMVFALISRTPCIVFQNKSWKIIGVHKWIKDADFIMMSEDCKTENDVNRIMKYSSKQCLYSNIEIRNKINQIIDIIR